MGNLSIQIRPNLYLKEDGTFDMEKALVDSGINAGICYAEEGFEAILDEPSKKSRERAIGTLARGHHSVFEHVNVTLYIKDIPKILAMVINNEKNYATSERSLRYTSVRDSNEITECEKMLYKKWTEIFKIKIRDMYGNELSEKRIERLAKENARYLVTIFVPTEMIYTVNLRQLNYIASWMQEYIKNVSKKDSSCFEERLAMSMQEFLDELERLKLLHPNLMTNEKKRSFSLFNDADLEENYGPLQYSLNYQGTLSQLAHIQRHRTLKYSMKFLDDKEFYVPEILKDDQVLVEEWLSDCFSLGDSITPQGQLVLINEHGDISDFLLKCTERLCANAQKEVRDQTSESLDKLSRHNPYLESYTRGCAANFPTYTCPTPCKNGGKCLRKRKI